MRAPDCSGAGMQILEPEKGRIILHSAIPLKDQGPK